MKIGTKSLLVGAHQFILHPVMVALAWRKLHGSFPRDGRIWVAFVVHDWGYWGKLDMDGADGVTHPRKGAHIMARLFDDGTSARWYRFAAGHSRTYAKQIGMEEPSELMAADKLATVVMPRWLYVALCWLSGEWVEYKCRWYAAGTYPGHLGDNVWELSGHLRDNWRRFERKGATAGIAYGGE